MHLFPVVTDLPKHHNFYEQLALTSQLQPLSNDVDLDTSTSSRLSLTRCSLTVLHPLSSQAGWGMNTETKKPPSILAFPVPVIIRLLHPGTNTFFWIFFPYSIPTLESPHHSQLHQPLVSPTHPTCPKLSMPPLLPVFLTLCLLSCCIFTLREAPCFTKLASTEIPDLPAQQDGLLPSLQ